MEGGIYLGAFLEPHLQALNKTVTNGCSLADMRSLLTDMICPRYLTSQAAELCAEFIIDTYNMDGPTNDTERVIQFIKFTGLLLIVLYSLYGKFSLFKSSSPISLVDSFHLAMTTPILSYSPKVECSRMLSLTYRFLPYAFHESSLKSSSIIESAML